MTIYLRTRPQPFGADLFRAFAVLVECESVHKVGSELALINPEEAGQDLDANVTGMQTSSIIRSMACTFEGIKTTVGRLALDGERVSGLVHDSPGKIRKCNEELVAYQSESEVLNVPFARALGNMGFPRVYLSSTPLSDPLLSIDHYYGAVSLAASSDDATREEMLGVFLELSVRDPDYILSVEVIGRRVADVEWAIELDIDSVDHYVLEDEQPAAVRGADGTWRFTFTLDEG